MTGNGVASTPPVDPTDAEVILFVLVALLLEALLFAFFLFFLISVVISAGPLPISAWQTMFAAIASFSLDKTNLFYSR